MKGRAPTALSTDSTLSPEHPPRWGDNMHTAYRHPPPLCPRQAVAQSRCPGPELLRRCLSPLIGATKVPATAIRPLVFHPRRLPPLLLYPSSSHPSSPSALSAPCLPCPPSLPPLPHCTCRHPHAPLSLAVGLPSPRTSTAASRPGPARRAPASASNEGALLRRSNQTPRSLSSCCRPEPELDSPKASRCLGADGVRVCVGFSRRDGLAPALTAMPTPPPT